MSGMMPCVVVICPRLPCYGLQVIDDAAGSTLAATSTLNPEIRQQLNGAGSNVEAAKLVGAKIAELCKQKNIEKVGGWRRALRGKQVELAS